MTSLNDLLQRFPVEELDETSLDPLLELGGQHLDQAIDVRKDAVNNEDVALTYHWSVDKLLFFDGKNLSNCFIFFKNILFRDRGRTYS